MADPPDNRGTPASTPWPASWRRVLANVLLIVIIFGGNVIVTAVSPGGDTILRWVQAVAAGVLALLNVPSMRQLLRKRAGGTATTPLSAPVPVSPPAPRAPARSTPDRRHRVSIGVRRLLRWRRSRWERSVGLPLRVTPFVGRSAELEELARKLPHRQRPSGPRAVWRGIRWSGGSATTPLQPARPPVVLIDGMPGIGKTALAYEFAQRIAGQYPHGVLYASLRSGGGADRAVGEVLKEFLLDLGWPERDIPEDTKGRGDVFRSLTRDRRILLVLDAAGDRSQVTELLPSGHRCAVIVTSRRNFATEIGAARLTLTDPSLADAVEQLRALTTTPSHPVTAPELHEVARSCGRLPLALSAAAQMVRDADDGAGAWSTTIAELAEAGTRLQRLVFDGTNPQSLFATEYAQLIGQEQRALHRLSALGSAAFVPWVLRPLLQVSQAEAESVVTRLNGAHMLQIAGVSEASGWARYKFHPLVKIFADSQAAENEDPVELEAARSRLDLAYRGVCRAVLADSVDACPCPAGTAAAEQEWLPDTTAIARVVLEREQWIRTDHHNLARAVLSAYDDAEWRLCWQMAARMGDCVPAGEHLETVVRAVAAGAKAAESAGDAVGAARVLLATGSLWVGLERYTEAFEALGQVVGAAAENGWHELQATALRRRAEAHLQMAAYNAARADLAMAEPAAVRAGDSGFRERERIRQLQHICRSWGEPAHWQDRAVHEIDPDLDQARHYYNHLAWSEAARRKGDWPEAHQALADASREYQGDRRRQATVEYWIARLYLTEARAAPTSGAQLELANQAIHYASRSLSTFQDVQIRRGEVRARCLLMRALAAGGRLTDAFGELPTVERDLAALNHRHDQADALLRARLHRAHAELLVRSVSTAVPRARSTRSEAADTGFDRATTAVALLNSAIEVFAAQDDWWSAAESRLWLARAYRLARAPESLAISCLHRAAEEFIKADDKSCLEQTLAELKLYDRFEAVVRREHLQPTR